MKLPQHYKVLLFIPLILSSLLCFSQRRVNYRNVAIVDSAVGMASFYSDKFVGRKTANGELFSQEKLTCAHNTLPFGTYIRVTELQHQRSVVVRVNDRLHHHNARLVDLSKAASRQLGLGTAGVIKVKVEVIQEKSQDQRDD
jgi:rare lipoprotein A